MVHFYLLSCVADTAWFTELRARSHLETPEEKIDCRISDLKTVPLLCPVAVRKECDVAVGFAVFCFDDNGRAVPKSLKDLAHRALIFRCQRSGKGEF